MEFDIFVSHSSKDKTMADAVCAKLEQAGIRCWIAPRDVQPGMTWSGEIMKAIEQCKVMVLVFSSNANESPQIVREVESAVHRGKPILPLRIEDIQPCDSMAFFMNSVHWLDAISEPHERHLDQLVQAVSSLLGKGVAPKPAPLKKEIKPGFDWKQLGYLAGTVLGISLLMALVIKFNAKPSSVTAPPGGFIPAGMPIPAVNTPAGPAPQTGSVDPSMTGAWYLKTTIANLPAVVTASYDSGGDYKIETVISDSGTYEASAGHSSMVSKSGAVQQGTYSYVDPHNIEGTGPLGTAKWTDDFNAAPLDPNNPTLVGTWQTTVLPPNSAPWNMSVTYRPDGTYSAETDIVDEGSFTSANGRMSLTSHTFSAVNIPATYSPAGQDSMLFTGPAGPATWSRTKP